MELSINEAILRLFLSLLLGSIVGLEREYGQQSAGLRTHILVCMGSTIFTIVSIANMTIGLPAGGGVTPDGLDYRVVRDPGRIAAQIVTGIGFIGGGAVLRHGASVRGLTTAASLWTMASIGMLIGIGFYRLAIIGTLFSFLVLFTIGAMERSIFKKYQKRYSRMRIQVNARDDKAVEIEHWISKTFDKKVIELNSRRVPETETSALSYVVDLKGINVDVNDLSRRINAVEGVSSVNVKMYHPEEDID